MTAHESWMRLAIDSAQKEQTPFGCAIVENGEAVAVCANTTRQSRDATAHAEMNALRRWKLLQAASQGFVVLYTTAEPCAMCAGGIVFAGVDEVVFGLSIPEVARYLPQIHLSSQSIFDASWRRIPTTGGVLNEECRALFERFA